MKIEKKKISSDSRWSSATKTGLAALMGMAAIAFSACDGQSSSDFYPPLAGVIAPETSSSTEPPSPASSNQVIVDIPKSSSSFSEEVLSSIAEATQSSSSEAASSSAIPASSSSEPASSSSDIQFLQPETSTSPWQPDTNSYIHMCPDGTGNCMVFSMVTTFERTDIDV